MTSKKDPPANPATTPVAGQVDPLAGQPIEFVIEVLATAGGKMQGLDGSALKRHVASAITEAQRVVADVERKATEEEQRKAAAAEIANLLDTMVRTGSALGKELQKAKTPLVNAFRAADFGTFAAGLQQLMEWMQKPSAENDAQAKALLKDLENTMAPAFGIDPEAAENARREQMKADVRASLDAAFRGKDFAATLKKKKDD
jgi:hypothetical protein